MFGLGEASVRVLRGKTRVSRGDLGLGFLHGSFKKRIAIVHPRLGLGGTELTAMWMLQSLQHHEKYSPTLVTGGTVDWSRLNTWSGTNVIPEKITIQPAYIPIGLRHGKWGDALHAAFFERYCRKLGGHYDLCISAYNMLDFGAPGLQFIGDLNRTQTSLPESVYPGGLFSGLIRREGVPRATYLAICRKLRGPHTEFGGSGSGIISNSHWTRQKIEELYGIKSQVLYPPVALDGPGEPLCETRTQDFVILGRLSPEKRVGDAIAIIQKVRERGHKVRLHVLGSSGPRSDYAAYIRDLCRRAGSWVVLHGAVAGEEKRRQLLAHSFGLHLRLNEAFGIAVAEQIRMGMIPFVPSTGGPAEIVEDPRLIFGSDEEAVEKIIRVIGDLDLQRQLRERLTVRGELFSSGRFVREFESLIEDWFAGRLNGTRGTGS